MIKRITLLRRKGDLTDAEFRKHWAEPHAEIAKGFEGLARYNQNRVDEVCWRTGDIRFNIHGIVELWFTSLEAVARNAKSKTTSELIEDGPKFMSALTALSVGETSATEFPENSFKYMIFAVSDDAGGLKSAIDDAIKSDASANYMIDPLTLGFTREALDSEPVPPNVAVTVWVGKSGAAGLLVGKDAKLREVFAVHARGATAYLVNELRIV